MRNQILPPACRALRSCVPALAAFLLLLAPLPASAQPVAAKPALGSALPPARSDARAQPPATAVGSTIDTSDRAAVAAAYRDVYRPAVAVHASTPTTEDVASCTAGTTPTLLQDATLHLVNYFRGMSQVPSVTLDPALSARAQQAALMMYANHDLSHEPPSTWNCYSDDGADAAGHSNLGLGFAGADVVDGYMRDDGSSNTEAGHRWWLQRPAARVMGNGTFGTANALWVVPSDGETSTTTPAFTSWPSAGYFPAPLEPAGRWSFSPTDPTANLSAATVSVTTGDGTTVPARAYAVTSYNSLVFEVGDLAAPTGAAVTTYDVTVSGVQVSGQPADAYRYTVRMIDPSATVPPPVPPLSAVTSATISGSTVVGSTLTARPPQWSRTGVTTTYSWLRDGRTIPRATRATYRLAATDLGHRISVRATGTSAGEQAVSTSSRTAAVTKIRSALMLAATSPAVGRVRLVVRLEARGRPASGVVNVTDGTKVVARALKVVRGVGVYSAKAKPGAHAYTVSYAGSATVTSDRAVVRVKVRDRSAAHLAAHGTSSAPKKVTFRIGVSAAGQPVLGGSVKIARGSKTVVKKVAVRDGVARYTASKQPTGKQRYTVTYLGTASVKKASAKLTVTVKAPLRLVSYLTCDAMDADYPHGVGKSGASDSTSGTPVTDFYRSNALYAANDGGSGEHDLDRDNDGIACER